MLQSWVGCLAIIFTSYKVLFINDMIKIVCRVDERKDCGRTFVFITRIYIVFGIRIFSSCRLLHFFYDKDLERKRLMNL